jgi:hypothetical protein
MSPPRSRLWGKIREGLERDDGKTFPIHPPLVADSIKKNLRFWWALTFRRKEFVIFIKRA